MKQKMLNAVFILIAIFLGVSLTRTMFTYQDKVQFQRDLRAEYDKEKALNKQLKSDLSKSSDYFFIERHIREKLHLLQEREVSIIIPDITPTPTPEPQRELRPYEMWMEVLL